jgi:hypothetical protein
MARHLRMRTIRYSSLGVNTSADPVTLLPLSTSINVVACVFPLRRSVTDEEIGTIDCRSFDAFCRGFR